MKSSWRRTIVHTLVFVILYVLIGNAKSIEPNPFIPGAIIAIYMVVPVIAGILFGMRTGLLVGLIGTAVNAGVYEFYDPKRAIFEFLAIMPHGIMGLAAGWFKDKMPTPFVSLTIFIGHALNITAFIITGKMEIGAVQSSDFWLGIGYEGLVGIIAIIIMVTVYRLGFYTLRK